MKKFLFLALFFLVFPEQGDAAVFKLGQSGNNPVPLELGGRQGSQINTVSCLDNSECAYDEECAALRCEKVCKSGGGCLSGTYCVPAGEDFPHEFKCVECAVHAHCQQGMFCDRDHTCKKIDPCLNAVCSPAAPFCSPKPYQTLPYTCVQCLENAHCPPVGGLTRSCVDGFCLFNVKGNIGGSDEDPEPEPIKKPEKQQDRNVKKHQPLTEQFELDDEIASYETD